MWGEAVSRLLCEHQLVLPDRPLPSAGGSSSLLWRNCCASYSNQVVLVEIRGSHDQAMENRILLPAFPQALKSMAPEEEATQENRNPVLRGAESREEGPGNIPVPRPAPPDFSLTASLFLSGCNEPVNFPWGRYISFLELL